MNIKTYLIEKAIQNGFNIESLQFPDCQIEPENIKAIMINEVPPQNPDDGFYSRTKNPNYMETTLEIFNKAGLNVRSIKDILNLGIYITTAVKFPKTDYTVETGLITAHLPLLEAELALFPNLKAIMLNGDVAKKAVNMIVKARTKMNLIPSGATYKIRGNEFYWDKIRVFPSYILTGKNLLIEKGKCDMTAEDIRHMAEFINKAD